MNQMTRIGTVVLASYFAIGCTVEEEVTTVESELGPNSCKAGDSSHTLDPAITCKYTVSSSTLDTDATVVSGAISSGNRPGYSQPQYFAKCYVSGVSCKGNGTAKPVSCPSPEYPATGQDVVGCGPTFDNPGMMVYVGDVWLGWIGTATPTEQRATAACLAVYKDQLTDAGANKLCNATADGWTNDSKKAPICCFATQPTSTEPTPTTP